MKGPHASTTSSLRLRAPALLTLYFVLLAAVLLAGQRFGEPGQRDLTGALLRALALLPLAALGVGVARSHREMSAAQLRSLLGFLGALGLQATFAVSEALSGPLPTEGRIQTALLLLVALGALVQTLVFGRAHRLHSLQQASLARTDPLTGLLNREALQALVRGELSSQPAALVMVDLNLLREVNERQGHGGGDHHIQAVGGSLRRYLGEHVGRWGGDEFVALLPHHSAPAAEALARIALADCPSVTGELPAFAFGVTERLAGEPMERALARADQLLYEFKHAQRAEYDLQVPGGALEDLLRQLELLRTPEQLIGDGLDLVCERLHFDGCAWGDRMDGEWQLRRIRGPGIEAARLPHVPSQRSGLAGRAAHEARTLWSSDYAREPDAMPSWVEAGLKSLIVTPVWSRGEVVGALGLLSLETWRAITPQVRWVLEALALRLGHVLDLQAVASEVRASLEGGLLGLGAAMEARDLETGGHTARVVALSGELGLAYGLDGSDLEALRQGAYLHDIGKLAVPDAVLLKPGHLTDDEWQLMRPHAERGYEMAARIPSLLPGALDLIRLHHERWDGSGYPLGLRGEQIPLFARLFAVVDVYDALISERPYKPAWTPAAARAEILAGAGRLFDPQVVARFVILPGVLDQAQAEAAPAQTPGS